MDVLAREQLASLVRQRPGWPRISIFMPTYSSGPQTQQNPIRLKNLLQRAEESLVTQGVRGPDAHELLKPATDLFEDGLFWREQGDGLAVFLAQGAFQRYRLPLPLEEQVVLSDRFHVKPLLPLFSGDGRFYVLALSQGEVRLLLGTRLTVSEVQVEGMPKDIHVALRFDEHEREGGSYGGDQARGGERTAVFYGIGARKDVTKINILRYFQQIDRSLHSVLRDERVPLVVAGVDFLLPIYKEANTYDHLLAEGVPGNPETLNDKDLQQQAWRVVEPYFRHEQEEALSRYFELVGTGRASSDPRDVVLSAQQGRVDTLLTTMGVETWGSFDPDTTAVELHAERQPGDEDLADLATVQSILNRGSVYTLPREQMPGGAPLAAIFRY